MRKYSPRLSPCLTVGAHLVLFPISFSCAGAVLQNNSLAPFSGALRLFRVTEER